MHTFCNHLHTPFKHCLYFTIDKTNIRSHDNQMLHVKRSLFIRGFVF